MKEIKDYLTKQKSPQKEILVYLRKLFLKTLSSGDEKMKWGVITFAGGKFYLVGLKNQVNVGFAIAGLSDKERGLFEGSGKTMRHLKIKNMADIDEKRLVQLIKLVDKKAECKFC